MKKLTEEAKIMEYKEGIEKNKAYVNLGMNDSKKSKLLENCKNKKNEIKSGAVDLNLRRNDNMKKNKDNILNLIKTSVVAACAVVATGLVLYGVSNQLNSGKSSISKNETKEQAMDNVVELLGKENYGLFKGENGNFYYKNENGILLMKNAFMEDGFKKMQKNCYDDNGNLKEDYVEETYAGETFAVSGVFPNANATKNIDVKVVKKDDEGKSTLVAESYSREFFTVDGNLYILLAGELEDKEPVVLAPFAFYPEGKSDKIEGWSLSDEGKYYWLTGVEDIYDLRIRNEWGLVIIGNVTEEQLKNMPIISCKNNEGQFDLSDGKWISAYDACMFLASTVEISSEEERVTDRIHKSECDYFCISDGLYKVGDYVFKSDEEGFLYKKIGESEYRNAEMKTEECSFYVKDNCLYYLDENELREFDLAENKDVKLFDVKDGELKTISDDMIFVDDLTDNSGDKHSAMVYDLETKKIETRMEGEIITVEGGYVIIKTKASKDDNGDSYTLYKVSDGKMKEIKPFIENGKYIDSHDGKFYYVEFEIPSNHKNCVTRLFRSNMDGSEVEKLVEYKKKGKGSPEIPVVGIGFCYFNQERFDF